MKAVFWPEHHKDDAQASVRVGRVIHWALAMIATCLMVSAPVLLVLNYREVLASKKEHQEWLEKNPPAKEGKDGRLTFKLPLKDGHYVEIEGDNTKSRADAIEHVTSAGYHVDSSAEPFIVEADYFPAFSAAMLAVFLFFIGRASRYIIAGE
ncbi:hypothetical protein [Sphingobium fuliginis]|uniref:PepSY domain-containing protein n=1 Tax=Sphingobium fuliginis ATCC 27551 TaxID=1208342 RepID=A0A5B8CGN3_SPHSA|nr:hypothetical protein [Sphingobium fuliginis]QDC38708.1 hypothetical protein FIL70_17125 [Sphingobium fuliginis ATCC 27551]